MPQVHAFSAQLPPPWKQKRTSSSSTKDSLNDKHVGSRYTSTTIFLTSDALPSSHTSATQSPDHYEQSESVASNSTAPRVFIAPSHADAHANTNAHAHADIASVATIATNSSSPSLLPLANDQISVLSYLNTLWAMTRPSNFLGVVLFHTLGTYLAINKSTAKLIPILLHPQQIVVLISLMLTSATSMVVNDYYDAKSGLDSAKPNKAMAPLPVVKRFLGFLYAPLLLCTAVCPGIPARLSVLGGTMLTFLYTQHLKPITWIKTVTCALLIALSPLTSGVAALALQQQLGLEPNIHNYGSSLTSLFRLGAMLFFGFLGREILMDINDVVDDRLHRIKTVPVRYGRQFASRIALVSTCIMGLLCLLPLITSSSSFLLLQHHRRRQVALGLLGTVAQIRRAYQVAHSGGTAPELVDKAVEEGKLTVLFLLASYI
ncbi:UbiA prenyltransferase family [Fragilaria crotonensis]|nr:UbiA prenyltransferase family [Fragilaria crotonensis]